MLVARERSSSRRDAISLHSLRILQSTWYNTECLLFGVNPCTANLNMQSMSRDAHKLRQ